MVIALLETACVDVNGGAVELSWEIRANDGSRRDCTDEGIVQVNLCAQSCDVQVAGACAGDVLCPVETWACSGEHGATQFEIPAGPSALSIQPICDDGTLANGTVPDPIVRTIANGRVTQLNALLIVVPTLGRACDP